MSFIYISNPYNGSDQEKEDRTLIAAKVCASLLRSEIHSWSPIVHNHAMMANNHFTLEERQSLILDFDFSLLRAAKSMIVLKIDGWKKSYGVKKEIELCEECSIPIFYIDPNSISKTEIAQLKRSLT
jgi:hypothetical protein